MRHLKISPFAMLRTCAAAILLGVTASCVTAPAPQAAGCGSTQDQSCLILLGTAGGPVAKPLRSQPSAAIMAGNELYMIDMGAGTIGQMAKAGFKVTDVDAVFFTHNHLDHNADLGTFMAFRLIAGLGAAVDIVGPPGTQEVVRRSLQGVAYQLEIFASEVANFPVIQIDRDFPVTEGVPGVVYKDEKIRVTAVENTHFKHIAPGSPASGRDKSYSYRFDMPDKSIVITGDTGWSDDLVELARGADILVSEIIDTEKMSAIVNMQAVAGNWPAKRRDDVLAHHLEGHLPAEDVGRLATMAGVKTLVLTHFVPTPLDTLDTQNFVSGVRNTYSGPLIAGYDLQVIK